MPIKTKHHILVVDDDEAVLDSIKFILEDEGYSVDTAIDGALLNRKIEQNPPDLIVLDYRLPGLSGTEITKQLKSEEKTKHIPILIASSHDVQNLAKEAGASAFFEKPFDIETLISLVKQYLDGIEF